MLQRKLWTSSEKVVVVASFKYSRLGSKLNPQLANCHGVPVYGASVRRYPDDARGAYPH